MMASALEWAVSCVHLEDEIDPIDQHFADQALARDSVSSLRFI